MSSPGGGLVESAVGATYVLSSVASTRLRKMTREAGLPSENILSRLAIVESLQVGSSPGPVASKHSGKEIKGLTLLGKAQNGGALLVLLVVSEESGPMSPDRLRDCITGHWERGVNILATRARQTDLLADLAANLTHTSSVRHEIALDGSRRGGLGEGVREQVAAAVGRRHGRWPLEVRRLVAMAGRLDIDRALTFASDLEVFAASRADHAGVSEGLALDFMQRNDLNRLGLNGDDRRLLRELSATDGNLAVATLRNRDRASLEFLKALQLVAVQNDHVQLSPLAKRLGEEVWA